MFKKLKSIFLIIPVFISGMVYFNFAYAIEVEPGSALMTYSDGTEVASVSYNFDETFGPFLNIAASTVNPIFSFVRASPVRNEAMSVNLSSTGVMNILRWDGDNWNLEWTENGIQTTLDTRSVGARYERSGEFVVVWSANSSNTELEYTTYDFDTGWAASQSYDIDSGSGGSVVTWVELSGAPASGSYQNDLGMCYVTSGTGTKVGCSRWNGDSDSWSDNLLIENDAEETTSVGGSDTVDVFFEQSSGQMVVIYGIEIAVNSDGTEPQVGYVTFDPSSGWSATASYDTDLGANKDGAGSIKCESMPTINESMKNRAACVAFHDASDDTWVLAWDGTQIADVVWNVDPSSAAGATGRINQTIDWFVDGSNVVAVAVWGDSVADTDIDYKRYIPGTGWQTNETATGMPVVGLEANYNMFVNPYQQSRGILLLNDGSTSGGIFAYSVNLSGTAFTFAALNGGSAISASPGSTNGLPMGVHYFRHPDPTFTHFRWYNDDGAPGSATARAAEDIKASGSAALAINSTYRLRTQISNEGPATVSLDKFRLEFTRAGTSCVNGEISPGWTWRPLKLTAETASDAFDLETSIHFTDGASVSAALTSSDPNAVNGYAISARASTGFQTLNGNNYADFEWNLKPNSNANTSASYCFRTGWITDESTNPDTRASMSYSKIASASVQASLGSTFTQNNYRWYYNVNDIDPTSPITTENTAISILTTQPVRLRINLDVNTSDLEASTQAFKLRYSTDLTNWTSVGSTTSFSTWKYYENQSIPHGTTLTTTKLTNSNVLGVYHASNSMPTNPNSATTSQYIEYDFSLNPTRATPGITYYFRMFKPDNTPLSAFTNNPTLTIIPTIPESGGGGGGASSPTGAGDSGGGDVEGGGSQGGGSGGGGTSGDTGFQNPTATGESDNDWSTPTNAYSSNDLDASFTSVGFNGNQDYYNFNLTVPDGATIRGIEVRIEAKHNGCAAFCQIRAELSWDTLTYTGSGKATAVLSGSDQIHTLGGSSDTWGRTWSSSEFSNSNFRLRITDLGLEVLDAVSVDHIQIKVHYSTNSGGGSGGGSGGEGQSGGGSGQGGGGSGGGGGGGSPVLFDWRLY